MEQQQHEKVLDAGGYTIKGIGYSIVQVTARFQIWCRQFGIDDSESFCLIISKDQQQQSEHYAKWFTPEEFDANRASALEKIDWSKLPESFDD